MNMGGVKSFQKPSKTDVLFIIVHLYDLGQMYDYNEFGPSPFRSTYRENVIEHEKKNSLTRSDTVKEIYMLL